MFRLYTSHRGPGKYRLNSALLAVGDRRVYTVMVCRSEGGGFSGAGKGFSGGYWFRKGCYAVVSISVRE